MNTEILISCDDWENRVAVLEEGSLAEIYFEREEKVIGSIYKGRVENVLPGMGASFVNIGLGRNAFLYVDDIARDPINLGETEITDRRRGHTVNELLRVGDDVLVQIVKEPRGLKGARVSTNISLPGRYLVLMPTGRYSGVSSRIEDDAERERLKQIMRRVRPEGMSTIVRTAARGVSEAELIADLGVQLRLWHGILESYKRAQAPALLHKDLNLVFKAVRDFMTSDVSQVLIDSKEQYEEIRATMSLLGPQYIGRLKLWEGPGNLFQVRGIDEELQKLLKPKILLPSGGHLIIDTTEALTVIDVNTGKFTGGRNLEDTLVRTNIEAAAEVARQVRLRDIGGIIVVDFIDMAHERSRDAVIQTLSDALRRDRTRSTIQAFSNLGLLEFTRKRVGKDLSGQLRSDCPYCGGLGDVMSSETIAIDLLRKVRQRGLNGEHNRTFDVVVDPAVATQLAGWYSDEFVQCGKAYEFNLRLFVEPQRHREHPILEDARRASRPLAAGREYETELLNVRLPDPSSGVAAIEGNIVEVKDAANGAGQTVKVKIVSADGPLAKAELSEPLQSSRPRRRRGGRGRGRAAAEAETEMPIAPPVPLPAAAAPLSAASRSSMPFGIDLDDEEEEDYTLRSGRAAGRSGMTTRASAPREPQPRRRGTRDAGASRESGRERPRGRRTPDFPPPLIVGGEGDIDYDDGEDSSVVIPSSRRPATPRPAPAPSSQARRREPERERAPERGRGVDRERAQDRARPPIRERAVARAPQSDVDVDREDEGAAADDQPRRRRRRRGGRGRGGLRTPAEHAAATALEHIDAAADELATEVEREPERPRSRTPKFFGPITPLYGPPVTEEREPPRRSQPAAYEPFDEDEEEDVDDSPQIESLDDDLDVVIDAGAPAHYDVDVEGDYVAQQRPPRAERPVEPREYRDRGRGARHLDDRGPRVHDDRGPRERDDRGPRERTDRGPRDRADRDGRGPRRDGERSDRGDRGGGRGGRGGRRSEPRREGPAVKQLYPPPGAEQEAPADDGYKAPPLPSRRTPHGPMMRDQRSVPLAKGKVRQLYPPPPEGVRDEPVAPPPRADHADRSDRSAFVDDPQEHDERRRRARERADARHPGPAASETVEVPDAHVFPSPFEPQYPSAEAPEPYFPTHASDDDEL